MDIRVQFAEGFSVRDAAQKIEIVGTIQELAQANYFDRASRVISTKPNNYLGVVFHKGNEKQCVLLGVESAKLVQVGTKMEKHWTIVKAINADGEERFRIGIGTETDSADEFR